VKTDYTTLIVNITGAIAEIVLNQPDTRNAVSHAMHAELTEAFLAVRKQPDVRAIVFAANGKIFSAGGDFNLILADCGQPERRFEMVDNARALFLAVADCPIPVVAALQGEAVGLATTLVLGCDAIVAAKTARLSDPHVVIGLVAGDGGCVLWPQAVGLLRAKRYLLTGDRLTASEAHAMGLVTDLVDTPEEVRDAARALAERIAALPPLAVQLTKRALNQGLRHRMEEVFDQAIHYEFDTFLSSDMPEAIAALRERRPGQYKGQ